MEAPDKIYLKFVKGSENGFLGVAWADGDFDEPTEYIRKEALLEWAKNLKDRWCEPPESKHSPGCVYMLEQVIDKINSL